MKEIDATKQKLGRIATQAAMALMGKDTPQYTPNKISGGKVHISNASKLDIDEKKKTAKRYAKYSGYPGGLRFETMAKLIEKKGYEEIVRKAVRGMLPANRLRAQRLKNLTISE